MPDLRFSVWDLGFRIPGTKNGMHFPNITGVAAPSVVAAVAVVVRHA